MGFVVTLIVVIAVIGAGFWIFEDDDHDEWKNF